MSYITRNKYGAFCSVCGEPMTMEEEDWDTCDCCGGAGFPEDDDYLARDDVRGGK